jgi:4-diphosphocytidyl-2-C-methyl-D-erythritol kinase
MRSVTIPSFAKVNLCLHILGPRDDGYHELRTVFQTIALHDTLTVSLATGKSIHLESNDQTLPAGPDNLVWRALEALRRELKLRSGIRARLEKRIPVGRGLGGGSSNAAAALIGLLRLTGRRLPVERLFTVAASLGADVPFFLGGGTAAGVGRGDEIFPLPDAPRRGVLVVSPRDVSVLTRDAYSWIRAELTNCPPAPKIWSFCALCWSRQGAALSNDFEKVVFRRHPRLARIKRELLRVGAAEAALAGSGSAVYGLFHHPAQARRAASALSGFSQDRVFVTQTISRKEYLRALRWPGMG